MCVNRQDGWNHGYGMGLCAGLEGIENCVQVGTVGRCWRMQRSAGNKARWVEEHSTERGRDRQLRCWQIEFHQRHQTSHRWRRSRRGRRQRNHRWHSKLRASEQPSSEVLGPSRCWYRPLSKSDILVGYWCRSLRLLPSDHRHPLHGERHRVTSPSSAAIRASLQILSSAVSVEWLRRYADCTAGMRLLDSR